MVHLFSDLFPHKLARSRAWEFEGAPLVSLHSAPSISWRTEAKRVIDFAGSVALLLLLLPLFLLVALAIKTRFGRTDIFRPGTDGLQQAPLSHDQISNNGQRR